jgi:hypothetical protein
LLQCGGMPKLLPAIMFLVLTAGCSASSQKPAIATALDNRKMRDESFEATLRVLDEHPEYVDEFFKAALRHQATLDRFLRNTAHELERDEFARFTAERLVTSPAGLKQILIAVLDTASDDPAALHAMSEAMAARPQLAAIVVVQSDASIRGDLRALLAEVLKNPDARRSFLVALSENSDAMARILAPNPEVLGAMLKAFAKVGAAKGKKELEELSKALE